MRDLLRRIALRAAGLFYLGTAVVLSVAVPVTVPAPPTHETTDADPRRVVAAGIGLVVALAVAVVLASWFFVRVTGIPVTLHPPPGGLDNVAHPAVALPPPTAAPLRAAEERRLASYGWVDRGAGIVHVPIDRAMALLLERGLPARRAQMPSEVPVAAGSAGGRFVERSRP